MRQVVDVIELQDLLITGVKFGPAPLHFPAMLLVMRFRAVCFFVDLEQLLLRRLVLCSCSGQLGFPVESFSQPDGVTDPVKNLDGWPVAKGRIRHQFPVGGLDGVLDDIMNPFDVDESRTPTLPGILQVGCRSSIDVKS